MKKAHNHSDKVVKHIKKQEYVTGAAAGAAGAAAGAAYGGGAALVAANGVLGGHAMKAMVETIGAKPTAAILAKCGGASSATIVLPIGLLGYEFACNVYKYYNGEIDAQSLIEKSVTSVASVGVGALGGWGGAVVGAEIGVIGGPVGSVVGAVVGAVVGGVAGAFLGGGATESGMSTLLGGSTDRRAQVRKAYATLELDHGASNAQVREAYKRLAHKTHPDKGGNEEQFVKINTAYELIRAERGEPNHAS